MNLNSFAADLRRRLFEDLEAGRPPSQGAYSEDALKEAKSKGKPQMGTTRFSSDRLTFEFIYPDSRGAAGLLAVEIATPERIVYMPVPEWVIEQIWQGEVTGSYHFLSDAERMLDKVRVSLEEDRNRLLFP